MSDLKDKKKKKKQKKDTDFTDEIGGGEDDNQFAKEDFFAVLKKVTKTMKKKDS